MSHSTPTPKFHIIPFTGRIALVCYELKGLRRQLAGLLAIEQMLRPPPTDPDADIELIDLFKADLAELLATLNEALSKTTEYLIELAEANQQEVAR